MSLEKTELQTIKTLLKKCGLEELAHIKLLCDIETERKIRNDLVL